jgi:myo-inositol-1(or 4)-monophosphatase
MNLNSALKIGIKAAYQATDILNGFFGSDKLRIDKKGTIDLVTEADKASEKVIIETIRNAFPDHAIMAEESGGALAQDNFQWIIDPLDGTTNFAHGLGLFAISIALLHQSRPIVGIVLEPRQGDLFTAIEGQGAQHNGHPIEVSAIDRLGDSLLVTGFPYNLHDYFDTIMQRFNKCLKASQGVRRLGSAAIDLCYVACGRFEAFWEENLQPWDTAAGVLIAREAGGTVSDFEGNPFALNQKQILATNTTLHQEMLNLLEI